MLSLYIRYREQLFLIKSDKVSLNNFCLHLNVISIKLRNLRNQLQFSDQDNYPARSLACKMFGITGMDCSNRDLFEVPLVEQNQITLLDLSHNHLMNITGAPFEILHMLLVLDLSYNDILSTLI